MKKTVLSLLILTMISCATEYIQPDRMKNMQEMEKAMATIQKGFLYNNIHVVRNGVKDLKDRAAHTESFIKPDADKGGINTLIYAKKQTREIIALADQIEAAFEKGDQYHAANDYLKILSKCLSCHQTIRKW